MAGILQVCRQYKHVVGYRIRDITHIFVISISGADHINVLENDFVCEMLPFFNVFCLYMYTANVF